MVRSRTFSENLKRPDAHALPYFEGQPSCCGAGDVVDTKFKVEHGDGKHPDVTWYALLKGKWVPDSAGKDRSRLCA